jgi:hypothetical protein
MTEEQKALFELLYKKYKKLLLSKKECSVELNRSCSSLDRCRKSGLGIQYIKESNGNIYYPLTEIVKFIYTSQTKTFTF